VALAAEGRKAAALDVEREEAVLMASGLERFPLLLKLTEVPLFLGDVPLSTFVSVVSALKGIYKRCLCI